MFYQLALFVHVIGAIGLFVAIGITHAGLARLRAAGAVGEARQWAGLIKGASMIHPPSALAILLPGVYLSATAWGWGQAWIDASLALTVLLAALAPAINGRKLSAIGRTLDSAPDGPLPAGPRTLIHDPVLHAPEQVMTALGLGIVFLMTVKPGPFGTATAIVVALVLGCATSLLARRTVGAAAPGEVARTATD